MAETLDIEKIRNNDNAKVIIRGFNTRIGEKTAKGPLRSDSLTCYLTQDTGFQFGSNFESVNSNSGAFNDLFNNITKRAQAYGFANEKEFSQRLFDSKIGTIQNWNGTELFSFSIPTIFIAARSGENPLDALNYLLQATVPEYDTGLFSVSSVENNNPDDDLFGSFVAPNRYTPGLDPSDEGSGTFSVKIGTWFEAPKKPFLIRDASFEISKEVTSEGTPLYVRSTITFQTYRSYSLSEMREWIRFN